MKTKWVCEICGHGPCIKKEKPLDKKTCYEEMGIIANWHPGEERDDV